MNVRIGLGVIDYDLPNETHSNEYPVAEIIQHPGNVIQPRL